MPDALAKGGEAKDPGAREECPKDESGPGHIRLRNRALILAAAEELFATQGYRGATTAALSDKAGMPTDKAHYYFGTHTTLYLTVVPATLVLRLDEIDQTAITRIKTR